MRKCVTDEAAEVVEAVDNCDIINLREELGDLLLQVLMYTEGKIRKELVDIQREKLNEKMIGIG